MKLALRKGPTNPAWNHRLAVWLIRNRLVSRYSHGGIVIHGYLYHANASHGVSSELFVDGPEWELLDIDGDDVEALCRFAENEGSGYDWFSLLAFALIPARDSRRWYCFELCYLLMTGKNPTERVTPEDLLLLALRK
jgi:hypothetical protein